MTRKYPFVVGNNSSEEAIEKAYEGLRSLVELGRKAEEALEMLNINGHFLKAVVWAEADKHDKTRLPVLRRGRFPTYVPVSRADIPGLTTATMTLGIGHDTQYGGHSCTEYTLLVSGELTRETNGKFAQESFANQRIGQLRVSGRAVSYLDSSAFPVTTKMKKLEPMLEKLKTANDALSRIAMNLRSCLIVHGKKQDHFTQPGYDLWKQAPDWILEDGIALKLLEDAIRILHVKTIMDE